MIASAPKVLDFWFKETPSDRWFAADPEFDAVIRKRFLETWEAARDGKLSDWEDVAAGAFALIIVLDQFPRNMFRGAPEAFSTDAQARSVAGRAIAQGYDLQAPVGVRNFFYLPFMHSENMADQDRSVELIGERCSKDHYAYPFALDHREIVRRFGRFPARNAALGRVSTPDETAFLTAQKPS